MPATAPCQPAAPTGGTRSQQKGVFGMRRRDFIALFGAAAARPLAAHAQQPAKRRRIGYLDYGAGISPSGGFAPFHDTYRRRPFLEGLRERGWVEGQNVTIERRFAAGQANRLPALAAELVALNVDVMLVAATPAAKAAQNATSRIAIVMADPGHAVERLVHDDSEAEHENACSQRA